LYLKEKRNREKDGGKHLMRFAQFVFNSNAIKPMRVKLWGKIARPTREQCVLIGNPEGKGPFSARYSKRERRSGIRIG
jgi:hypothetical protein